MVVTTKGFQGALIDYLYQPDVLIGNGAQIELYGSYQPAGSTTFNFANLPTTSEVTLRSYVVTPRGVAFMSRNADVFTTTGTATIEALGPAIPGTLAVTDSYVTQSTAVGAPAHEIYEWGPPTDTHALDYGSLAGIQDYTVFPAFDIAHHSINWTESTGATPDYVGAGYYTTRGASSWVWGIVAPRTSATSVTFPTLPVTNGIDYNSAAGDHVGINSVENVSDSIGYDAIRPWGFASFQATTFAGHIGGSGRVMVSRYVPE